MSKWKIYEFDPILYPRLLWIVKKDSDFIREHFRKKGGYELTDDDLDMSYTDAWVCKCERKSDNRLGILFFFDTGIEAKQLVHECYHALTAYVSEINADLPDYDSNGMEEFAAYLIEWIFDCCWKVKQGKVKEVNCHGETEDTEPKSQV